jgi:hypothetical protein
MQEGLNPGDKVIALAAAATTAAVVAGAVTGTVAAWLTKHKALTSIAGLIGGVAIGWCIGELVGRLLFPASSGNKMIAKWGSAALPLTLKGNIVASLVTSLVICGLMVIIGKTEFKAIAGPCIGSSVVLGVIFALLASLI